MFKKIITLRQLGAMALLATSLGLAGCSDSDSKGIVSNDGQKGTGAMFHGAEWATIKNLDPRGEECVQCHGKDASLSPNGGKGHNIGLKNYTDNSIYASLKIKSATVVDGKITVTTTEAIPADKNPSMTFAKLSPRVRHDRGHDWQNYLNAGAAARGDATKAALNVGLAPQMAGTANILEISSDRRTLSFDLKGNRYNWGEHEFPVSYKSGTTGQDAGGTATFKVTGTKVVVDGISEHISCFVGHKDANQVVALSDAGGIGLDDALNGTLLCWWPDGSSLPAGVFVSDNDEVVVSYEEAYTHRVTLLLGGGSPSYNTWFDFVPDGNPLNIAAYSPETSGGTHVHQQKAAARDVVDIQSCNSCHDSLALSPGIHGAGGSRSETQVCVTCHNPGNLQASSGRSVDFKQLIHRIHRGSNLPSIDGTVTNVSAIDNSAGGKGLLSGNATDWTKVRFPQGATPGNPAGITNCVKCHMGPETKRIVQELATEIGPGPDFDIQKELKLAKVTTQGDNWLNVRNMEACRGCHDAQIWMNGSTNASGAFPNGNPAVMETSVPLYGSNYLGIGYDWIGVKGATKLKNGTGADAGFKHSSRTIGESGNQFSCGSGGGCHSNVPLNTYAIGGDPNAAVNAKQNSTIELAGDGTAGSARIHRIHLQLTRDYILAERFEIRVKDVNVDDIGFHVTAELLDKKNGNVIANPAAHTDPDLGSLTFTSNAMFGWMANGSPDYNHSAGGGFGSSFNGVSSSSAGQPGAPAGLKALAFDAQGEGSLTITWAEINAASGNNYDFDKDFDKASSFGTVAINASMAIGSNNYRLRSANQDFSFADGMLAEGELARRQVVDFLAGQGNDASRDRYAGWDKEHGSNTQSCSSCHLKLDMHGATASNNTQMCVMCHNPNVTDLRARIKDANDMVELGAIDGQYEESEDFKRLIHAVHAAGGKDTRIRGQKMRIDPLQTRTNERPSPEGIGPRGHSFPGVLSNCKSCHIQDENTGKWTFELDQLPKGMIGSTAITADWSTVPFSGNGPQHNLDNHMKMSPITSVCSSCHDAGYKTSAGRMNNNILDGGPYIGSHWWVMGGIAPGIVPDNGTKPSATKHQSGK